MWRFTKELTSEVLRTGHAVALVSFGRSPSLDQRRWCDAMGAAYGDAFTYGSSGAPLEWMNENELAYEAAEPVLLRVAGTSALDFLHASKFCYGGVPLSISRVITAHSGVLSWAEACKPDRLGASTWLRKQEELVQDGLSGADAVVAATPWIPGAMRRCFRLSVEQRVILNERDISGRESLESRALQAVSARKLWDPAKNLRVLHEVESAFPISVAGEQSHDAEWVALNSAKVIWLGSLTEEELLTLFREGSIYLATSIYVLSGCATRGCALWIRVSRES